MAPDVAKVLAGERPNGGKGGRPRKDHGGEKPLRRNNGFSVRRSPTSAAALASRLQNEHPAFYQGYLDGTYGSITAAAEAAGLVPHGHDPLKRLKQYWNSDERTGRDGRTINTANIGKKAASDEGDVARA